MPKKKTSPADTQIVPVSDARARADRDIEAHKETSIVPIADGPEALLSQAVAAGADIGTIERLMVLRKDMLAERAKQAFNEAMAAFQSECPVIKKTKVVKTKDGKQAYKYAPIESIVLQVKKLVQRHGFRYSTSMTLGDGKVKVLCRIVHKLGGEEISEMEVPLGSQTAIMSQSQVVAAASTFAKRYAFLNAFGVMTGDEDTDAVKIGEAPQRSQAAPRVPMHDRTVETGVHEDGSEYAPDPKDAELETKRRQAHAVWNEFCKFKGIEDANEKTAARHKATEMLFKKERHMNEMPMAELLHFIAQVQIWTKSLKNQSGKTEPLPRKPHEGAEAAQEVFPGAKAVEEPAKTPTQPSPISATSAARVPSSLEAGEIDGMKEWISKAESLDELNEIWEEIKADQVRIKAAGEWIHLHQAYIKRRAALKKMD